MIVTCEFADHSSCIQVVNLVLQRLDLAISVLVILLTVPLLTSFSNGDLTNVIDLSYSVRLRSTALGLVERTAYWRPLSTTTTFALVLLLV